MTNNILPLPPNKSSLGSIKDGKPSNDWQKWFNKVQTAVSPFATKFSFASAAPTSGEYAVGDIVFDTAPIAGGNIGWVCITATVKAPVPAAAVFKAWGPINP